MKRNTITGEVSERVPDGIYEGIQWHGGVPDDVAARAGWVNMTAEEAEAMNAAAATQRAIEAGERLRGLAVQWGGMIAGLRAQLLTVGHDIPCDAAAVMGDLLTRTLRQELTQAQGNAKGDIADIYGILTAQGLTNQDIADVWELVKAGQSEGV
jgi:hypothetical protein